MRKCFLNPLRRALGKLSNRSGAHESGCGRAESGPGPIRRCITLEYRALYAPLMLRPTTGSLQTQRISGAGSRNDDACRITRCRWRRHAWARHWKFRAVHRGSHRSSRPAKLDSHVVRTTKKGRLSPALLGWTRGTGVRTIRRWNPRRRSSARAPGASTLIRRSHGRRKRS